MTNQPPHSEPIVGAGLGETKILPADEVIAPDPLADVRSSAASLPDDADDDSDAGMPTTSHENEGWRAVGISRP